MTARSAIPSIDVFRQLLAYDPETGRLSWMPRDESLFESGSNPVRICRSWNAKHAGCLADNNIMNGYRSVCVFNRRYLAHRVAWAIASGSWPMHEIDHINQDKTDNRLVNLRDVAHSVNARNQPVRRDNKTGLTGIWQKTPKAWGAKWVVVLGSSGGIIGKKSFKCLGQAVQYRNQQYRSVGFSENHGNWKSIGELARRLVENAK